MNRARIAQAARRFTAFHEVEPSKIVMHRHKQPDVTCEVGEVLGIIYKAAVDGVSYKHMFRPGSRPLLTVSSDGKTLVLVGGHYLFTDRGITDK